MYNLKTDLPNTEGPEFLLKIIWSTDMKSLYNILSHNNSFASGAFIFISDVYLALFAMRSL